MTTPASSSSFHPEASPLLVGIVVDVSYSMRRNWHNKDGKKLPRIEVIRDALNKRIKEEQKHRLGKGNYPDDVEIFCLGMGFQAPMHISDVHLSYDREHHLGNVQTRTATDLVCDLLALGEILPSKEELTDFKTQLNQKWQQYAKDILDRSMIVENVYANLVEYLQDALYKSAIAKLHQSIWYKLSHFQRWQWLSQLLQKRIKEREEKIAVTSQIASARYANDVCNKTNSDFRANTNKYVSLIRQHLEEFAASYITSTLKALTLGFEISELVEDLDEKTAIALTNRIQTDLEAEVGQHIKLVLTFSQQKLHIARRSIAASLNRKKVIDLTKCLIRKSGWDILRPLIEETVYTIFAEQFEKQAKANFPYWIRLASTRELTRPLSQLANILPDVVEQHIYSDQVMFGTTPFVQAIDRAAIRLIDRAYEDRRKVLIILSDGEFEQIPSVMVSVNLLKRRGTTIICCLIADRNILSGLVKWSSKSWPAGTQLMVEVASQADEQIDTVLRWKDRSKAQALTDEKLCFQVNQSDILEDVLGAIFDGNHEETERM